MIWSPTSGRERNAGSPFFLSVTGHGMALFPGLMIEPQSAAPQLYILTTALLLCVVHTPSTGATPTA